MAFAASADGLTGHHSRSPAEADLVEVEGGVLRTAMMENTGDRTTNAVVEALRAVGVYRPAGKFVSGMANRIMGGEMLTDGHEPLPFIGHLVCVLIVDVGIHHAVRIIERHICDDLGANP